MTRISPRVIQYVGRDNMEDSGRKLPSHAWPGGYPLYYVAGESTILCPDHANAEGEYGDEEITAADVNWEDPDLWCEHGHRIESAYAED